MATNVNGSATAPEMTPAEKRALLAKLLREKGRKPDPAETPVHRLFEAQASRTPGATAVSDGSETLTYADLNARANRLARHLRGLGVGPELMVGLCAERGVGMVVGLLGILKAGGAYVPLDPGFPPGRLAFMLDDARVPVLLTQGPLVPRLAGHEAKVVLLDRPDAFAAEGADNLEGGADGSNLAYAIYTSGSSGQPKGVLVPHRALSNFLLSMAKEPGLSAADVLLAVTTLSFDIAALELFLPLVVGAQVDVAPREVAADGRRLAERLKTSGATVLQATPATWRMLLESGWEGGAGLTALCGGEALHRDLAERLLGRVKALWNLYGPTETTVWSTLARVEAGEGPVSIGRPVARTRAYVLDAGLRPVPVGVAGELYLAGAGLARGYHERPALTAERFLVDPFSDRPDARMYRTGDLARYRADGALDCLGRVDGQVKVRGFRIELGEVESALAGHPSVRESAAAARDDASGEKRLLAYVVPRGDAPAESDLRAWLKDRLPEYMVPSVFVTLDALPLTPNGKVDRKALPEPEPDRPPDPGREIPPRGPIEEALAGLWAEALGRERVGAHDDFFEAGGHSLLAAHLLARVRDTFGTDLPLKALFDAPTVAGLGRQVEDALRSGAGVASPPLVRVERDGPPPASFAQQRMWFLDQLDPGSPAYNIAAAVRLEGALDVDALRRAFAGVAARHEALRTTLRNDKGLPVQVIAAETPIDVPVVDLTTVGPEAREAEAVRLVREESWRPFDLANGPLWRARLYRVGGDDHLLALTLHHAAADGWSIGVLIRDAAALYEGFTSGRPATLPDLPVQYADHAAWQRDWLRGDVLDAHLGHWREALAGLPTLEVPTDRPRPAKPSGRGATAYRTFDAELTAAVKALGRKEGATLFMTLLAGFEALLGRYSGQADFAVGTPIAGRTRSETEGLIGYFANTLVLRADLAGDPGFRALLGRVKARALDAYARQDLPFDHLVEAVRPDRDPSRSPLFQAMFVLQNAPLPALKTERLALTPVDVESVAAKFDLTLSVTESAGSLLAALEYATDLFDRATADRMLAHLETLLRSAAADPEAPVSTLPMLTEAEQRTLAGWNAAVDEPDPAADLDGLSDDELDALLDRLEG